MNYTIFSIDDRRKAYTDEIRRQLDQSFHWKYSGTRGIDGSNPEILKYNLERNHVEINTDDIKVGQLGIYLTVLNALWMDPGKQIVTFEDDAILHPLFNDIFWPITSELPRDTDAFALFLPRDQDHVFDESMMVGKHVCRAYQRYGGVSMLWTPQGADKFLDLVERDGIIDQWDNQLFKYAKAGEMNVYTQRPGPNVLVSITGQEISIVQESETYK